jgi:hypothetical protein
MNKDAYYFPHFANARHDRKLKRIRKELGPEGYGIFFMILEVLREQEDFAYPLSDIDLLADDFNTSEQKVETVIKRYDLFVVDDDQNFFSPKFIEYLSPYLEKSKRARNAALKRWHGANAYANALPEQCAGNAMKGDEMKREESIDGKQVADVPSLSEVKEYFNSKGYDSELATKFYSYYDEPMRDRNGRVWKDQNGKTVKSWKQKAVAVWMKDEGKSQFKAPKGNFV